MAARESKSKGRSRRNPAARAQSPSAPKPPSRPRAPDAGELALPEYLRTLILNLQRIMSVVIVSVGALQKQNADLDADVAHVLRSYAGNKLYAEIESAEKLLKKLNRAARAAAK